MDADRTRRSHRRTTAGPTPPGAPDGSGGTGGSPAASRPVGADDRLAWLGLAREAVGGSAAAVDVAIGLALAAGPDGSCALPAGRLAAHASIRSVWRGLADLERAGLLQVDRRGAPRPATFRLHSATHGTMPSLNSATGGTIQDDNRATSGTMLLRHSATDGAMQECQQAESGAVAAETAPIPTQCADSQLLGQSNFNGNIEEIPNININTRTHARASAYAHTREQERIDPATDWPNPVLEASGKATDQDQAGTAAPLGGSVAPACDPWPERPTAGGRPDRAANRKAEAVRSPHDLLLAYGHRLKGSKQDRLGALADGVAMHGWDAVEALLGRIRSPVWASEIAGMLNDASAEEGIPWE